MLRPQIAVEGVLWILQHVLPTGGTVWADALLPRRAVAPLRLLRQPVGPSPQQGEGAPLVSAPEGEVHCPGVCLRRQVAPANLLQVVLDLFVESAREATPGTARRWWDGQAQVRSTMLYGGGALQVEARIAAN